MKYQTQLIAFLLCAVMALSLGGCTSENKEKKASVSILYGNWAEAIAMSYLANEALLHHDFEVKLTSLEPGLIYGELSKKNSKGDVYLDAWLPNTHKDYWKQYGEKIDIIGKSFDDGTTGLVVPAYMDIQSITELNDHKEALKGKIIGIGSGAGIHAQTLQAIDEYALELEQITSSGPAMVAALEKAYKKQSPIVITGWKPHYKWAQFDLKYLEDPKGIYQKDECTIIARQGFKEDQPEAAQFFANFNLSEEKLYDLMGKVATMGEVPGAKAFYAENKALVDGWFL
ncbi:glycine betaine ABC transporter substrate-binding protein [Persicobacter diffluens]|uniref:ABC transporter substrate-binding protein n=1 Tax=Persicobacter diffluens TaxID=981 RepID=A0AAN5ALS9_9BACT|nr:ABC transporter substrate-binding protein [Persicobacter diffluens]